jgi:predicted O-methyltransferase YrrM
LIQFALARAIKPEVIPEVILKTGVANGISSSYWLLACHLNGRGRVHSIDIDNGEYLPPGKPTGWMAPDYLRGRWTLELGDARDILPKVLGQVRSVDIFVHDSNHSYEHMKFEFDQVYPHIRPGGLLLSDDVDFNSAFSEFADTVHPKLHRVISGVGILKKDIW